MWLDTILSTSNIFLIFLFLLGNEVLGEGSGEIISTIEGDAISYTIEGFIPVRAEAERIIEGSGDEVDKCTVITDCIECVKSNGSCTWLMNSNVCKLMDDKAKNATRDVLIENENNLNDAMRKGVSFCFQILPSNDLSVPSDTHKMIAIKVSMKNGGYAFQTKITCRFGAGPNAITTNAVLLADTIYCNNAQFSYTTDEPFINLPLSVMWGNNEFANPRKIKLTMYKCRYMANTCITCLSQRIGIECGWCPSTSTCEISGQCEETSFNTLWIGRRALCPEFTQKN